MAPVMNAKVAVLSICLSIETDSKGVETRHVAVQSSIGPLLAVSIDILQDALTIAHAVEKLWVDPIKSEAA